MVSVQFSRSVVSDSLRPHESQHARPPCPSPSPGLLKLMFHWVGDAIQAYHPLLSPSPPAFNLSQHQGLFKWVSSSDQVAKSIWVSASTSVLLMKNQDWSPLGWNDWISLQSKGLSRVFSNTTIQKHRFFRAQLSLWSNSHIHTYYWKNHSFDYMNHCLGLSQLFFQGASIF